MENLIYITVILPLKLEWEPYYSVPANGTASTQQETSLWTPDCFPPQDNAVTPECTSPRENQVPVTIGTRVRVRFSGREYIGVTSSVGIEPRIDKKKILPITAIEHNLEKITANEISLWRKVAEYYLCTTGEVYKTAYPSLKTSQDMVTARQETQKAARLEKLGNTITQRLARLHGRLDAKQSKLSSATTGKQRAACLEAIEKISKEIEAAEQAQQNLEESRSLSVQQPSRKPSAPLERLSQSQSEACRQITTAFAARKPVLLRGVTGSGKTEIYMHLAEETLNKDQNVLYLVPEIAMGMQLESRIQKFFDGRLLVFHSKENTLSKRQTAIRIRSYSEQDNGNYILLGTRSALFLPHSNLGLIIIDEEHDNSYKQDSPVPKYNGRDTAMILAMLQENHCNVILGSATPSLESIYNCYTGKYALVELNNKFFEGTIPEIDLIDTIAERRKRGMVGNFSRKLIGQINATLSRNEQVLILRARRSYSPVLQCTECGDIPKCPHCNVSLSYNKTSGRMLCHYCGHSVPYTGHCGICSGELRNIGAGTQKIEEEATALFPDAVIARLDSDSAQNRNFEKRTIKDFAEGRIDILIGTQIIAKGFDFENVTLVVLLQADAILGIEDFRADEKALQLMEQLRGRCGRRTRQGKFVIQTSQSTHPIYGKLACQSAADTYNDLLCERKDFGFPPFSRIVIINIKDKNEKRIMKMAASLSDILRADFDLTGPYQPVIDKVSDFHIRCIRISLPKDRKLASSKQKLYETIEKFGKDARYNGFITIDVDPA